MISKFTFSTLLLSLFVTGQDSCDFSVAAVQKVFDSFEEFRTLHAFDPTDENVAVTKVSQYKSWDGYNNIK